MVYSCGRMGGGGGPRMPWSETTKMQERMRFVLDAQEELFSMTELCGRYGISRVTGHKWLRRFREEGLEGLEDRSRAPEHSPNRSRWRWWSDWAGRGSGILSGALES